MDSDEFIKEEVRYLTTLLSRGLEIPESDRCYLHTPFDKKEHVKRYGGKWSKSDKKWYISNDNLYKDELVEEYGIIYLNVPFSDKDSAKKLGALWCSTMKRWYAPSSSKNRDILEKIYGNYSCLIGEDRTFGGNLLFVDMIPINCWFTNVRYCIKSSDWDKLRHLIYSRSNFCCECCGIDTKKYSKSLEAHERWHYDEERCIQKLVRIVALCHNCHSATHYGFSKNSGKEEKVKKHLKNVRKFTDKECEEHIEDAYDRLKKLNDVEWELDLSLMTDNGIEVVKELNKRDRSIISRSLSRSKRK